MPITSALKPDETQVSIDDPRLFNISDLALIMGVNRSYFTRMKACGFKMPGGRSSVARVHRFLEENPDLVPPDKLKVAAE